MKFAMIMQRLGSYFRGAGPRHDMRYLVLGAVIGIISACMAILFREAIDGVSHLLYHSSSKHPFWVDLKKLPTWVLLLAPVGTGAFVAWFTKRFAPEAQGHGVPEIIAAVVTNRGVIRPRVSLVKLFASALSIGSGFSVGREGPTAIIGATVGSSIGQLLKLGMSNMKMVVGCGAAAGIATTFNAPLAGTIFALEIIIGNFNIRYLMPIVLAAMLATVISHAYFGSFHELFSKFAFDPKHPFEITLYAGLGVLAGAVGILFTKILYGCEDFEKKIKWPTAVKGAIGGGFIGLILLYLPELSGPATWDAVTELLTIPEEKGFDIALIFCGLAFAKIVATSFSLASGASGGIFAPSLLIGGYLGAGYGIFVHKIFPAYTDTPSAYALVGMGALVASVTQGPLTAVTIIFEMTNNIAIILPLIVSSVVGVAVFNHFVSGSIYTLKLQRRGLNIEFGREIGVLEHVSIDKVMTREVQCFHEMTTIDEMLEKFSQGRRSSMPVVDERKRLLGITSFWDLRKIATDPKEKEGKVAKDVMKKEVRYVTAQQNLYNAFSIISSGDFENLPVVNNQRDMILVGRLSRQTLLETYKNRLTARGILDSQELD